MQQSPSASHLIIYGLVNPPAPADLRDVFSIELPHILPPNIELRGPSVREWVEIRDHADHRLVAARQIESLDRVYVFDERAEVQNFIRRNRLQPWLEQAIGPLNRAFGEPAIKTLKLDTDDEGTQTLFCLVRVTESLDHARNALAAFDREWWSANCGLVASKLNFDYELA